MSTDIFVLSLSESEKISTQFCETNFPERLKKAERFLHREDRLRCIGAGGLLHGLLGIGEKTLTYNAYGKPSADRGGVCFNLSHGGSYVILVTDKTDIGADIEPVNPAHLSVAERVFQPEERAWMHENPVERFFRLWTLKESVMKQCGLGLSLPPESFSVMPIIRGKCIYIQGRALYADTVFLGDHCISVCAAHPVAPLVLHTVTAEACYCGTLNKK